MIRCPACGIRLPDAASRCPVDGALPSPPAPAAPAASDAPPPYEVPEPVIAGLKIGKRIGQGGFGAVFAAERTGDGARVAVKVARADQPSASDRLVQEAEALRAIGSPHVPIVYDAGRLPDGAAYLVMEYVAAPTLAAELARTGGALSAERFAQLAPALLRIVEIAHDAGFIHCDLKPENVFVAEPDGKDDGFLVKLFDFGLVRRVRAKAPAPLADGASPGQASEDAAEGTPEYMSPEQCDGRGDLDLRSDVYALGVMLYEMACGAPPFWGNAADVQQSHRSRRPPALARRSPLAASVEPVILRCLAKDPERRFATLAQARDALDHALGGLGQGVVASAGAAPAASAATPARPFATASLPAAKPAAPARERRPVAFVFFESKNGAAVREALAVVGGQLAHTAGSQFVVAFGHEVGDNPTRAAASAAQLFVDRSLCRKALVDLASVSVQARPDGTRRYQSPLFTKKDQYPGEADPAGVLLSRAAAEVLPEASGLPVPGRAGFVALHQAEEATEVTTARTALPPMIGRDEQMRTLLASARKALGESAPTIATVYGEAGHGKSLLGAVLAQTLESLRPPVEVLVIRAKEALGGAGEQTSRELFRRVLKLPAAAPGDLGRALLVERLGPELGREVFGGVAVTMGWASPDHPELKALAAAPGALRAAAARAAGEGLRRLSRQKPLALVLEDAQFADETALDAVEYAALREGECPIWICAIGRPAFAQARTAWASRAARRDRVELPPLDVASASELARSLLAPAENVSATALTRLVERTQGIPLFLVELVRGLKRDGIVRRSEKTGAWFLATDELERLPDLPLVQWLASRETESLPADLVAHARLASVLGTELTADELEGVMRAVEQSGVDLETQLDASVGLRRLVESGLLVLHRQGRVGFRHALLRETVYQTVPAGQRESIHRAAYQYYEGRADLAEDQRLPRMALHAARSGLKEEAAGLYLELARRAAGRHAYLDAELLYRSALQNLRSDDDSRQAEAEQGIGMMRFRLGRHEDALQDLLRARERARAAGLREREVEILLEESLALDWLSEWARSAQLVEEAEALAGDVPPSPLKASLLYARGRSCHRAERAAEACELFEKSASLAETLGSDGYEIRILALGLCAWSYTLAGRFDEAESVYAQLVELCDARADKLNLTMVLSNRALLSLLTKNVERLVSDYRRVIAIARETGFPLVECMTSKDLAEVQYLLGRLEDAEQQVRRSLETNYQILGERARSTLSAELLLARILAYRGETTAARATIDRIRRVQSEARAAGESGSDFGPAEEVLVEALLLMMNGAAPSGAWDDLLDQARRMTMQPQDIVDLLELRALADLRSGRPEEGLRLLDAALVEAEKNADLMSARLRRTRSDAEHPVAAAN